MFLKRLESYCLCLHKCSDYELYGLRVPHKFIKLFMYVHMSYVISFVYRALCFNVYMFTQERVQPNTVERIYGCRARWSIGRREPWWCRMWRVMTLLHLSLCIYNIDSSHSNLKLLIYVRVATTTMHQCNYW